MSHLSLSDSKSLQVSRTLLSILADLTDVVLMVSTRPLISKSSSSCTNYLVTVASASITIGVTVTLMFHSLFVVVFFLFSNKISLFSFFQFYPVNSWNGKLHYSTGSLFL